MGCKPRQVFAQEPAAENGADYRQSKHNEALHGIVLPELSIKWYVDDGLYDCHVGAEHDDGVTPNVGNDGQPLDDAAQQQNGECSHQTANVNERQRRTIGVEEEIVLAHVQEVQHRKQDEGA